MPAAKKATNFDSLQIDFFVEHLLNMNFRAKYQTPNVMGNNKREFLSVTCGT